MSNRIKESPPIGVGFRLPSGTPSEAKNITEPGRPINLDEWPWGATGSDGRLENANVDTKEYAEFASRYNARYGQIKREFDGSPSGIGVPESKSTLHWTDFYAALETVAMYDPDAFQRLGYGQWTGGTIPTRQEAIDAWMTGLFGPGRHILDLATELGRARPPVDPVADRPARPSRPIVPPSTGGSGSSFISPARPLPPGTVTGSVGPSGDPGPHPGQVAPAAPVSSPIPSGAAEGRSSLPLPPPWTASPTTPTLGASPLHDLLFQLEQIARKVSDVLDQVSTIADVRTDRETTAREARDREWQARLLAQIRIYREEKPPRERMAKDLEKILDEMM